ncbi:PREDICTED: left-right determination factor 1 [Colobus angolensis palliatus]|uniref:left-right determination factor 1 n=1 Tax=Colobus angolensis palliatus TaxID=336983 RepID=UPI0005F442AC|nr:PREDICTED: left-right determination factor 1 [Colobus angolensis palliatus]
MRPLWLCCALWVLPLAGPGAALTGEQLLGSLLRQLQLSEAPVLDRADMEELVIPAHVRAQYVTLLQRSHGDRSRGKRFSQSFREVAGRFLASEASTHLLVFGMEQRLPPNSELVQAILRLFQEPVPKAALHRHGRLSPRSAWAQVSVQREHPGPLASGAHKLVRFASQGAPAGLGEPQLELHTLDLGDYGAQGDCDPEAPMTEGTRCCRQEMYIDLQGMKWAENWVLEPPGFLAYECVGTCQQPPEALAFKWPFLGPRQCIASETASLPMIVSIKEGGRTRPQVVSLPNMRVQKCSCASDGALVPRGLQP